MRYACGGRPGIAEHVAVACAAALSRAAQRVLVLFAGRHRPHDLPSVLRARSHEVTTYEWLDDPIEQNLSRRVVQARVLADIAARRYDVVVLATPCSSLSVALDPPIRSLAEPLGLAEAIPDWGPYLTKHNGLIAFSADVCRAAELARCLWLVENPAARREGVAAWPEKADRVSLFDMPAFPALTTDVETCSTTFAQCRFGSPFQKYTTLLAPLRARASLLATLAPPPCTCAAHAEHAIGVRAAAAAAYPPAMCDALADFIELATSRAPPP